MTQDFPWYPILDALAVAGFAALAWVVHRREDVLRWIGTRALAWADAIAHGHQALEVRIKHERRRNETPLVVLPGERREER